MKRIILLLCSIAIILTSCTSAVTDISAFEYTIKEDTVLIKSYVGQEKQVVIPSEIEGYPVTAIGFSAFGRQDIETVVIPDTVTVIEEYAFGDCLYLSEIHFGSVLITIEDNAFYGCVSLKNLELPKGLQSIGECAFSACIGLKQVFIPNSIEHWRQSAFMSDTALTTILFEEGTKTIGGWATFHACYSLETITFPDSVELIEDGTFMRCAFIKDVIFNGNAPIMNEAFYMEGRDMKEINIHYKEGTSGWDAEVWQKYTLVKS